MAFQATLEIKCWKEHACSTCGSVYRYLFVRKKAGQGNSEDAARAAATKAVEKALADEIEMRPCPSCGLFQPEMIGEQRRVALWVIFWLAAIVFLTFFILGAVGLWESKIPYFLGGAGLLFGVLMLLIVNEKPNRNPDKNRGKAAKYLEDGSLQLVEARDEDNEPPPDKKGGGFVLAAVLLLIGILAMPAAEWVRLARGWKVNSEWAPVVAGPGDTPWRFLDRRIECLKGYWNASGTAIVLNAQDLGLAQPRIQVSSRTDTWGENISVKSSEKRSTPQLWARVHVPPHADLAGKTLKLQIVLTANFPKLAGNDKYDVVQEVVPGFDTDLILSDPGAGALYSTLWWIGGISGAVLVLLSNLFFIAAAKAYRDQGLETRIVHFGPEGGDAEEERADNERDEDDRDDRERRRRERDERDRDDDDDRDRDDRGDRRGDERKR